MPYARKATCWWKDCITILSYNPKKVSKGLHAQFNSAIMPIDPES